MSASAIGQGGQIIALASGASASSAPSPAADPQPESNLGLPQIGRELENFIRAAREIEAALHREKSQCRKYRDDLRSLQTKHSQLLADTELKIREYLQREERLRVQLMLQQQHEKSQTDQFQELTRQMEAIRKEKQRLDQEIETFRNLVERMKQREEALRLKLEQFEHISKDLSSTRAELHRYQAAWAGVLTMDRQAKEAMKDSTETKRRVEDLTRAWNEQRNRVVQLEELLNREKREKQVALTCLHATEARLAQADRDLEDLKTQKKEGTSDPGLILKF